MKSKRSRFIPEHEIGGTLPRNRKRKYFEATSRWLWLGAQLGAGVALLAAGCGTPAAPKDNLDTIVVPIGPITLVPTVPGYADSAGWNGLGYAETIRVVDVNGDGSSDVCGRGAAGISCATWNGTDNFNTPVNWTSDYGDAGGWNNPQYYSSIQYGDVNGDGKIDICARAGGGVVCSLSTGSSFAPALQWEAALSDVDGFANAAYYTSFRLADINGDGKADACMRGAGGMYCEISNGSNFVSGAAWDSYFSDANGWSGAAYANTMMVGDVDGDGLADLCGRGPDGVVCEKGTGSQFVGPALNVVDNFSDANGWSWAPAGDTVRLVPPMDGHDTRICGRGGAGEYCAERVSTKGLFYFAPVVLQSSTFGDDTTFGNNLG